MNSTNKQKHNLLVVLEEVLEYRKTTFSTLATYQWEKKVSKKITNYFSRETYIEDLTVKNMRDFFSSIRFKENGELMSTKYLKSVKTIMQAVFNTWQCKMVILTRIPYTSLKFLRGQCLILQNV